jgi:hypothetical protein
LSNFAIPDDDFLFPPYSSIGTTINTKKKAYT